MVERWLAKIALAQCFYGRFYIEHNRGHHVRVLTPEDPASNRMGESFYAFWPRTVAGSLRSAWRVETKWFARRDRHPFRPGNDVLNAWLMSVVLWGALIALFGIGILPYLIVQAVFGFSLLEIVNYMEHYGLLRQKVGAPDRRRYERVTPAHSWNSNNVATNVLLYHLQRHSDHHANPTRRFQTLRDFAESPVLPTGYTGMMLVAAVPPLFRRMMDPMVVAHYAGDIRLANVAPGKLEKLLTRYPAPVDAALGDAHADTAARTTGDDVVAARCPGCGYTYDVAAGNELEGFAAGTAWCDIPNDWTAPTAGSGRRSTSSRSRARRPRHPRGPGHVLATRVLRRGVDELVHVLDGSPGDEHRELIDSAVRACPSRPVRLGADRTPTTAPVPGLGAAAMSCAGTVRAVPPPVSDTLALVADEVLADVTSLLTLVLDEISAALPDLAHDPRVRELLAATVQDTVVAALTVFSSGSPATGVGAPAAGLGLARRLAQQNVPISIMLRSGRWRAGRRWPGTR